MLEAVVTTIIGIHVFNKKSYTKFHEFSPTVCDSIFETLQYYQCFLLFSFSLSDYYIILDTRIVNEDIRT